jgi:hypothetical protein
MIAYNLNEKDVYQFRFAKGGNSPLLFFWLRVLHFLVNFTIIKSFPIFISLSLHLPNPHHCLHGFYHLL